MSWQFIKITEEFVDSGINQRYAITFSRSIFFVIRRDYCCHES